MAEQIRSAKLASQKLAGGGMKISMVEALKGKPGLMKQLKSIFDDLHGSREFSVYPEFPRLFADPESSDWKNIDRIRQQQFICLPSTPSLEHI